MPPSRQVVRERQGIPCRCSAVLLRCCWFGRCNDFNASDVHVHFGGLSSRVVCRGDRRQWRRSDVCDRRWRAGELHLLEQWRWRLVCELLKRVLRWRLARRECRMYPHYCGSRNIRMGLERALAGRSHVVREFLRKCARGRAYSRRLGWLRPRRIIAIARHAHTCLRIHPCYRANAGCDVGLSACRLAGQPLQQTTHASTRSR